MQTSPRSSVQEWLDRVPQGVGLAPSRASSRHPSVMTSVVQATLPLGAEAAAIVSQAMYMPSRTSQQIRRSRGSCPIEIVEGLMQITQQQRADAIQRESLQVQREVDIVQEAVREKEALRAEAARRETLLAEEKRDLRAEKESLRAEAAKEKQNLRAEALQCEQAIRDDARNRDKLFFDSNDRDKAVSYTHLTLPTNREV